MPTDIDSRYERAKAALFELDRLTAERAAAPLPTTAAEREAEMRFWKEVYDIAGNAARIPALAARERVRLLSLLVIPGGGSHAQ